MNKKSRSKDEPEEKNYTADEYLQEVTIGDRKPRNSTIQLDPYNPRWRSDFVKLSERVCQALGDKVLLLEHVGSTSVEGLSAKPIIDMLLVVLDSTDEGAYVPALEKQGFVLRIREPDWFEHRLLKGTDIRANLHVFSNDCEQVERMLTFRDRLRSNEADRKLYEMRKKELAARTWRYTQHYADAKSEVIREILTRAKE
ncbi:MAG: GrpB family protein [Anaerolineales bacterium]|jgi:GrpB-like predicted nucleotidyltransferase (UPF0157 family)